ncbi:RHS repeat-associated core domain-containing protein [Bradyrhizobium sp. ORS 285]|uniref:RHS repeat-associated core domain-containing protein n=1 Tax=Bradyrhizobium sp. ORS 285 TaxID=115808 RepID=UPI00054EF191|nr:RHS repeat-associated core domain-containing protein [Bradyrhizobium sp. ORS 285]
MQDSGYAGTIDGNISVDHNGVAVYTVDIVVPPGTHGAAPSLALAYQSVARDGILGWGWTLRGLSAITRVGSTLARDNEISAVAYGDADRWMLDGARLQAGHGASYHDPSAVYFTEVQTWSRVVPVYDGAAGRIGPASFTVTHRDGSVLTYGGTDDSVLTASATNPSVRVWLLRRRRDLFGNTIAYRYTHDQGTAYPSRIDYTSNDGVEAQRSVRFTTAVRPDPSTSFAAGEPVTLGRRLTGVQTYLGEQLVGTYALIYEQAPVTGRSRLLQLVRADANGIALPPTVFTWQNADPALLLPATTLAAQVSGWNDVFLPMDLDGNGRVDFVNAWQSGGALALSIFIASADGTLEPRVDVVTQGLTFGGTFLPMDIDGDGRTDLVYAFDDGGKLGLTVFKSSIDAQGRPTLVPGALNRAGPANLPSGGSLLAVDVDGDGLTDLVYVYDDAGTLGLLPLFSDGSAFAPSSTDVTATTLPSGGRLLPVDLDGDGRIDLAYAYDAGGKLGLGLYAARGRSGYIERPSGVVPKPLPWGGTLIPLDVDGDGCIDLVSMTTDPTTGDLRLEVLQSNARDAFVPRGLSVVKGAGAGATVMPARLAGSGRTDLLVVIPQPNGIALHALISSGTAFTSTAITQPGSVMPASGVALPLDLLGTGKTGLFYAFDAGGKGTLLAMHGATPYPDLLVGIANGIGGRWSLAYKPMTDPSVYAPGAPKSGLIDAGRLISGGISGSVYATGTPLAAGSPGATFGQSRAAFPMYVVANSVKDDARGATTRYAYRYTESRFDLQGRGWLGFASVTYDDPAAGTRTRTVLRQDFPFQQNILELQVRTLPGDALLYRTTHTYEEPAPATYAVPQVRVVRIATKLFTPGGSTSAPDAIATRMMRYDAWDNVVFASDTGDGGGPTLYTRSTYAGDAERWWFGDRLQEVRSADADGTSVLTHTRTSYDPLTRAVTAESWRDGASDTWITTSYRYDRFGNRTNVIDPAGGVRTTAYDERTATFPVSESVTIGEGSVLTWSSTYDARFGTRIAHVEPSGNRQEMILDGLGRTIRRDELNPAGKLVQVAAWSWSFGADGFVEERRRRLDWDAETWTWERTYVDGLSRTVRDAKLGPDGVRPVEIVRTYDGCDRVLSETLPTYAGDPTTTVRTTYDAYGRVVKIERPSPAGGTTVTTTTYPTVTRSVEVQAEGTSVARTITSAHAKINGQNVVLSKTDPSGTTTYAYDALGRITSVVDPTGVRTEATYDGIGRQRSTTRKTADGTAFAGVTQTYDDAARTLVETTLSGRATTYVHDALQRAISTTTADGATMYAYDGDGYGSGRLRQVTRPNGDVFAFAYDPAGNTTRSDATIAGEHFVTTTTYRPSRAVATATFPDGSVRTDLYTGGDVLERTALESATGAALAGVSFANFGPTGRPGTTTSDNGVTTASTYDPLWQLASRTSSVKGATVFGAALTRNALNSVVALTDTVTATDGESFGYDAGGRLISASGPYGAMTFAYDGSGNRTAQNGAGETSVGYQVRSAADGATSLSYDGDGNLVQKTNEAATLTLAYDGEGRMSGGGGAALAYDQSGRRVSKTSVDGTVTRYVTHDYETTQFKDGSAQHTVALFDANGARCALVTIVDAGTPPGGANGIALPGTAYVIADHRRCTRLVTAADGSVQTRYGYLPFGAVATVSGPDATRHTFCGRERDAETGLYAYGARYYDASLGRFVSSDDQLSAGLLVRDTFNSYAFAINDPLSLFDPDGHSVWDEIKSIGSAFVMGVVDAGLIVGGIAVLTLTGGAANVVGSTLLGAGIGGLIYNAQNLHQNGSVGSWGGWGMSLGVGAAVGFLGAAGSAAATTIGESAALGLSTAGRLGVNVVMGATTGSVSSLIQTVASNSIAGRALDNGWGTAMLMGMATGAAGALALGTGSQALLRLTGTRTIAEAERSFAARTFDYSSEEQSMFGISPPPPSNWERLPQSMRSVIVNAPRTVFGVVKSANVVPNFLPQLL